MEERVRMLSDYVSGHWSVIDLCRRFGVSRETFYAWRKRQMSGAEDWFVDRSHGTVSCPHRNAGSPLNLHSWSNSSG
nr:helix-turn-helix domain-containing protein [Rhizobium sophoriradicis]